MKSKSIRLSEISYTKSYLFAFLLLIVSLPFSYQPLIRLGRADGANYDLSVIYITAGILVALSGQALWRSTSSLLHAKYNSLLILFAIWCILSTFWSSNPLRATATAALITLMTLVIFSLQLHRDLLIEHRKIIWHTTVATVVVVVAFAIWQLFADAFGVSATYTLLPEMYRSQVFGFARITGFSAEPQFLGSLLLAPIAISYRLLITRYKHRYVWLFLLLIVTLTLTLSRGALLAGVAVLILTLYFDRRQLNIKRVANAIGITIVGLLAGVIMLSAVAAINTRDNISAYQALSKSVNQLSLGAIDLPEESAPVLPQSTAPRTINKSATSGYIAESTNSRLQMSGEALSLFVSSPKNIVVGVGVGGFGASLHQRESHFSESSVTGNHYIEVLVELGIIGFALFASFFAVLLLHLYRQKEWIAIAAISGLLLQWLFFSGYPNVLHLWIIIGAAIIFSQKAINRPSDSL